MTSTRPSGLTVIRSNREYVRFMETSSVYMYLESDELDDVQNIQGQYGSDESDDFDEDWKSYNFMTNIVIFSLELY